MFHIFEVAMFPVVEKPTQKKNSFTVCIANPTTQDKFNCPKEEKNCKLSNLFCTKLD
jgi:hypothetical protein